MVTIQRISLDGGHFFTGQGALSAVYHCTSPLLRIHVADEAFEQWYEVVRARTCLGMPLETESRSVGQRNALQRAVEQRAMCGLDIIRQG